MAGNLVMSNDEPVVTPKTILLVDDEPKIVEVLETYLVDEGFSVIKSFDGSGALKTFLDQRPDLVLLDLRLPNMTGTDVFHAMRAHADTPIIMLTSRAAEVDRVVGLELGADDYITKPFSPREVVARVRAVLRRTDQGGEPHRGAHAARAPQRIAVGDLAIDCVEHLVCVEGAEVALTPTEFRILEVLAAQPGRTFTRAQLLEMARSDSLEIFDRTLDRHIANLRHKIEKEPSNPTYVLTVFGVGYKMSKNPTLKKQ